MLQLEVDGQSSPMGLHLFIPQREESGESLLVINGIVVEVDKSFSLFGAAREILNITSPIAVNKFTRLQYSVSVGESSEIVRFCVFEQFPGDFNAEGSHCQIVDSSQDVDVAFGDLLNGKQADISFIGLVQEVETPLEASSIISDINIIQDESTDIFDENGCKDINAITSGTGESTVCTCANGFVSSNGGKIQGQFDACVACILSEYCRFDGEACSGDDECIANECERDSDMGSCSSRVSTSKLISSLIARILLYSI